MKYFYTAVTHFHGNDKTRHCGNHVKFDEYNYDQAKKGIDMYVDNISKGKLSVLTLETSKGYVFFSLDIAKNCVIELVVDGELDDYED